MVQDLDIIFLYSMIKGTKRLLGKFNVECEYSDQEEPNNLKYMKLKIIEDYCLKDISLDNELFIEWSTSDESPITIVDYCLVEEDVDKFLYLKRA